jgi:hypothetical protein
MDKQNPRSGGQVHLRLQSCNLNPGFVDIRFLHDSLDVAWFPFVPHRYLGLPAQLGVLSPLPG